MTGTFAQRAALWRLIKFNSPEKALLGLQGEKAKKEKNR